MVICNLAVLAAERGTNLSRISVGTGISRTTLSALANNTWKGVQADTISALCTYLKIDIGQLFTVYNFDISVKKCHFAQIGTPEPGQVIGILEYLCEYSDGNLAKRAFTFRWDVFWDDDPLLEDWSEIYVTLDKDEIHDFASIALLEIYNLPHLGRTAVSNLFKRAAKEKCRDFMDFLGADDLTGCNFSI